MSHRSDDVALLRRVIVAMKAAADAADDDALDGYEDTLGAFESMLARLVGHTTLFLTEKQRRWVADYDAEYGKGCY